MLLYVCVMQLWCRGNHYGWWNAARRPPIHPRHDGTCPLQRALRPPFLCPVREPVHVGLWIPGASPCRPLNSTHASTSQSLPSSMVLFLRSNLQTTSPRQWLLPRRLAISTPSSWTLSLSIAPSPPTRAIRNEQMICQELDSTEPEAFRTELGKCLADYYENPTLKWMTVTSTDMSSFPSLVWSRNAIIECPKNNQARAEARAWEKNIISIRTYVLFSLQL